jgi:DNA polymerase elongation subunit (family B)
VRRRDNANILKTVYGGIIQILLDSMNANQAVDFLDESLQKLSEGKLPMEELIITKALRSNYKNPAVIAHKCLADRMAARDPGNAPSVGE